MRTIAPSRETAVDHDDFRGLIERRWSCRAFLPDEVPADVIREMFDIAQRTASWCNTQPWQVYVTTGAATERFAKSLTAHAGSHDATPDFPVPAGFQGVYRERRRESGYALYASLDIGREDWDARVEQRMRNFSFFGAPHVAVITTDRDQGVYGAIDCGGYVANVLHAATSLGVATIPQAAIAMHSSHVHEHLSIPDDRMVVCAISFGYADTEHPVNGFRTSRATVEDAVTIVAD
jgi:nitroreductase